LHSFATSSAKIETYNTSLWVDSELQSLFCDLLVAVFARFILPYSTAENLTEIMMFSMSTLVLPVMTIMQVAAFKSTAIRAMSVKCSSRLMMNAGPISYKVGFMFPGQGAQTVGMAGALCAENPAAKALFDTAHQFLDMIFSINA
jgi:hypothetical protein